MKKLLLSIFMLTFLLNTNIYAQKSNQEQIKSLKIGFITQELDLTSKEAQDFWPVYNEHQDNIQGHHKEMRKLRKSIHRNGGIDILTNDEAEEILNQLTTIDKNLKDAEDAMYKSMKSILPAKKILKLHHAEKDFNRKILEEIRKRRGKPREKRQN